MPRCSSGATLGYSDTAVVALRDPYRRCSLQLAEALSMVYVDLIRTLAGSSASITTMQLVHSQSKTIVGTKLSSSTGKARLTTS